MKLLVTIANYGTSNDRYLGRTLQEYHSLPYDTVDVIVISDLPKTFGSGVQTLVAAPSENRRWLPHIHKRIFAREVRNYDLFIYSEDDHLITVNNIEGFLKATQYLSKTELAGFIVSEECADGSLNFPGIHKHFHWDTTSVTQRGPYTCAYLTNEHSASYVVTRQQLQQALDSGGFLVPPHNGKYNVVCSAATDIYTQCGFRKVICISHLPEFTVRHLPNKYVGKLGISDRELKRQLDALLDADENGQRKGSLVAPTKLEEGLFSKSYYEPRRDDIVGLIPAGISKVLSIGCGYGDTEAALVQMGIQVSAVPLDGIIAGAAESRGVRVIRGDLDSVLAAFQAEKFDCALMMNILHLLPDPVSILKWTAAVLSGSASIVVTVPNHSYGPITMRRLRGDPRLRHLGVYSKSGVHLTTGKTLAKWFAQAGFRVERSINIVEPCHHAKRRFTLGLLDNLLAKEIVAIATKKSATTWLAQHAERKSSPDSNARPVFDNDSGNYAAV